MLPDNVIMQAFLIDNFFTWKAEDPCYGLGLRQRD